MGQEPGFVVCSFLFYLKEGVVEKSLLKLVFFSHFFGFKRDICHCQKLRTILDKREKHALRSTKSVSPLGLEGSLLLFSHSVNFIK